MNGDAFEELADYVMRISNESVEKKRSEAEARNLISAKMRKEFEKMLAINEFIAEMKDL